MTSTTPFALVVVSAGASDPSSTRLLADRTANRVAAIADERGRGVSEDRSLRGFAARRCDGAAGGQRAGELGDDPARSRTQVHAQHHGVSTTVIDLRELATEITSALTSGLVGPRLAKAADALVDADGVIASTPVYQAGASGLFTSFFQVLDDDLLIAKPMILGATAGTARHALVVDDQVRALFAYLRALPVPTSLFAATEDWNDAALSARIDRAAWELVLLMESGFARQVRETSWHSYQHEFGSAGGTKAAGEAEYEVDLDSDLMRLAAGGSAAPGNR